MDPMGEEQLDYGEDDYGGSHKAQFQDARGAIPALAEDEMMPEDDDYDDLYNDVNVGEGFMQTLQQHPAPEPAPPAPFVNGAPAKASAPEQKPTPAFIPQVKVFEEGIGNNASEPQSNARFPRAQPEPKFPAGPSLMLDPEQVPRVGLMGNRPVMNEIARPMIEDNGPTSVYVGELHWWTTDAEVESMASQYGRVKELRFFDERASGKSKGYCQLEFYDAAAASACKDGMNGYAFNGRACVVTFASAQTLRQMGASSYVNKNQPMGSMQQQGRRPMNDGVGRAGGMNFQGGDGGRRGGWGRGGQGFNNRNQGGNGPMRGRGGPGAKGMMGPGGAVGAGAPYGQGLGGPPLGGPAGGMMHPQGMFGAGFDPTYMGRGGPYGGFSTPGFPGMMPSFQGVNGAGLHGVSPHVNPAFFGRGMPANGMGIMGNSGMEASGMWMDTSMGGWTGEEHGRGTRESSYGGDDGASEYGYGEVNHERTGKSNVSREKERVSEREWSGNSERRHRDEKERDWDRSDRERYREEKDGHRDHRQRDRDNDDKHDRGQSSSRSRSKMQEDDHRSRPRDADYGKRHRTSE